MCVSSNPVILASILPSVEVNPLNMNLIVAVFKELQENLTFPSTTLGIMVVGVPEEAVIELHEAIGLENSAWRL
jgi:hypothetical protein